MSIIELFTGFRKELDSYHDQRERVIKASRDITASSKKIIFALQRINDCNDKKLIETDETAEAHMKEILNRIDSIKGDLTGEKNQWRYAKQFSGCLEEYIEAISFRHYLLYQEIISLEQVRETVPDLLITPSTYLLGLMDLTGELMRYAIGHLSEDTATTTGTGDDRRPSKIALSILNTLRQFQSATNGVSERDAEKVLGMKEWGKKVTTLNNSLMKVEQAIYSLLVRQMELSGIQQGHNIKKQRVE